MAIWIKCNLFLLPLSSSIFEAKPLHFLNSHFLLNPKNWLCPMSDVVPPLIHASSAIQFRRSDETGWCEVKEDKSFNPVIMEKSRMGPMDENGGSAKVNGIWQIVKLKELLHKWQSATLNPKQPNSTRHTSKTGGISPMVNQRLKGVNWTYDSDEETCQSPEMLHDVPKGYLAVYVGPELRRFIVPTSYLGHNLFKVLLEKAEEEFGFDHNGALTLPCDVETFKYLLKCMESHQDQIDNSDDNISTEACKS